MGHALINHCPSSDLDTDINSGTNNGQCTQMSVSIVKKNGVPNLFFAAATVVLTIWDHLMDPLQMDM